MHVDQNSRIKHTELLSSEWCEYFSAQLVAVIVQEAQIATSCPARILLHPSGETLWSARLRRGISCIPLVMHDSHSEDIPRSMTLQPVQLFYLALLRRNPLCLGQTMRIDGKIRTQVPPVVHNVECSVGRARRYERTDSGEHRH